MVPGLKYMLEQHAAPFNTLGVGFGTLPLAKPDSDRPFEDVSDDDLKNVFQSIKDECEQRELAVEQETSIDSEVIESNTETDSTDVLLAGIADTLETQRHAEVLEQQIETAVAQAFSEYSERMHESITQSIAPLNERVSQIKETVKQLSGQG